MTPTRRDFLQSTALASALLAHAGLDQVAAHAQPAASPFLQGNYGPVREEVTADNLRVVGQLPRELDGMYVRNGPNPQVAPRGRYHWFDGDGMLHGVRLHNGQASYRNRYIRTYGWKLENYARRALWTGLAEPPPLAAIMSGQPPFKNAANTALVWHDRKLLALWEGAEPYEVRVPDLATVGPFTFGGRLNHAFTAHPRIDPVSGDMHYFGYGPTRPFVRYAVANSRGEIVHATVIDLPRAVMMHDFTITERYTIFLDLPETMSTERMMRGQPMMQFEPSFGARIGILPRRAEGRDMRWFAIEPCFMFHTLNAWEDVDEVVLIGCRSREFPALIDGGPAAAQNNNSKPFLHRWTFNMRTGQVREAALSDASSELPRINETKLGRRCRYGYAGKEGGELFDGLVKYDLQTGNAFQHLHGDGRFGNEGIFAARPGATDEDDGWVVTFVHDRRENRGEMVIINARDFRAAPVARVILPARVPYGFHGIWLPQSVLG